MHHCIINHFGTATSNIFSDFIDGQGSDSPTIYRSEAEPTLPTAIIETLWLTVCAMFDTLASTDPILLLAVVGGCFSEPPCDVKAGPTKDNWVELPTLTLFQHYLFPAADHQACDTISMHCVNMS